jgi:hypothetical protein
VHLDDAWTPHGITLFDSQRAVVVREVMRHELTRHGAGCRARGGVLDDPKRGVEESCVSDRVGPDSIAREEITTFSVERTQRRWQ